MDDKMKRFCIMMVIAPLLGIVMLTCICMQVTQKVSLSINGFAVDSEGCLYVGKDFNIEVFNEDTLIRTISPKTTRGYKFTIIDGQTILLSTSSTVYTMDLLGNVLSEREDEGTKVYNELQWKRDFVDENGTRYTLESYWGRKRICYLGHLEGEHRHRCGRWLQIRSGASGALACVRCHKPYHCRER